jgi:Ca2+-binding EF-hand superfamily protein
MAFAQGDKNSDGYLDLTEYLTLYTPKGASPEDQKFAEAQFRKFDLNGDGVLDIGEFTEGNLRTLKCMDANGDGIVDKDEVRNGLDRC